MAFKAILKALCCIFDRVDQQAGRAEDDRRRLRKSAISKPILIDYSTTEHRGRLWQRIEGEYNASNGARNNATNSRRPSRQGVVINSAANVLGAAPVRGPSRVRASEPVRPQSPMRYQSPEGPSVPPRTHQRRTRRATPGLSRSNTNASERLAPPLYASTDSTNPPSWCFAPSPDSSARTPDPSAIAALDPVPEFLRRGDVVDILRTLHPAISPIQFAVCGLAAMSVHGFRARQPTYVSIVCPGYARKALEAWLASSDGAKGVRAMPTTTSGGKLAVAAGGKSRLVRVKYLEHGWGSLGTVRAARRTRANVLDLPTLLDFFARDYARQFRRATAAAHASNKDSEALWELANDVFWVLGQLALGQHVDRDNVREYRLRPRIVPNVVSPDFWIPFTTSYSASVAYFCAAGIEVDSDGMPLPDKDVNAPAARDEAYTSPDAVPEPLFSPRISPRDPPSLPDLNFAPSFASSDYNPPAWKALHSSTQPQRVPSTVEEVEPPREKGRDGMFDPEFNFSNPRRSRSTSPFASGASAVAPSVVAAPRRQPSRLRRSPKGNDVATAAAVSYPQADDDAACPPIAYRPRSMTSSTGAEHGDAVFLTASQRLYYDSMCAADPAEGGQGMKPRKEERTDAEESARDQTVMAEADGSTSPIDDLMDELLKYTADEDGGWSRDVAVGSTTA